MIRLDDNIDHGDYHLEDCLDSTIEKYADGHVYCPITWSGGTCEGDTGGDKTQRKTHYWPHLDSDRGV